MLSPLPDSHLRCSDQTVNLRRVVISELRRLRSEPTLVSSSYRLCSQIDIIWFLEEHVTGVSVAQWANTLSEPQYLLGLAGWWPAMAWVQIQVGA